ncbi:MAG: PadR family transcriptional regulator [Lachnospiraceae bacterium]|jgi:DNA-binding PadR family transcriptional regulator|nr:PadR family transcriptional regulator [Lachnospiraceae bacterium]
MRRDKNLPLTETVYYILLALKEPTHGYVLMQKVEELSDGQVRLAAGTLYGAIENLLKKEFIISMPSDDVRRKVYALSQTGESILRADYQRMSHILKITEQILNGGAPK